MHPLLSTWLFVWAQPHRSIDTAWCRGTNQVETCSGRRGGWETYLPSTAATTLQLSSCSYKLLSIRSRRSDLRTRFIMNTWVHTNEKNPLTRAAGNSVRFHVCMQLSVCTSSKPILFGCLGGRDRRLEGSNGGFFTFKKEKRGGVQRECEMWWDSGTQNVDQGSAGDLKNVPLIFIRYKDELKFNDDHLKIYIFATWQPKHFGLSLCSKG